MEKRIFLAVVISIAVLALWTAIAPKIFPELVRRPEASKTETAAPESPVPPAESAGRAAPVTTAPPAAPAAPVSAISAQRSETRVIDTPTFRAVLTNRGAQLISFRLKGYHQKKSTNQVDLVKARPASRSDYPFAIEASDGDLARQLNTALYAVSEREEKGARVVEFRFSDGRTVATKTFRFPDQPFLFEFATSIQPPVPYRVVIGPGISTLTSEENDSEVVITGNGVVQTEGDFEVIQRGKGDRIHVFPLIDYIGIEDNYFLTALRPSRGGEGLLRRMAFFDEKKKRREDLYAAVNAASDGTVSGEAFFGAKETKLLDRYGFGEALQFGWFGVIARFLLEALVWINGATQNYGWAIVVLTIIIKIVLFPLQHKSITSMKKMQNVQPKVEAIKARYKKAKTDPDQRQKMNVEMMALYQKEGINPMAGCLPLVLQLPILWGFYNLLSRAIELRGAPFMLWIQDLSEKDPYYITPILMTATMFIQTYITPSTGDPMQRKMFLIMPLVFGFLFKDFASGLVLYWLVQNVLTIAQQLIMNKWWKDHPPEVQNA